MKRILIVVDMQNDFITGELPAEGADKIIPNVVKKMTQEWDLVYLTRDTHYGGSYEGTATDGWEVRPVMEWMPLPKPYKRGGGSNE